MVIQFVIYLNVSNHNNVQNIKTQLIVNNVSSSTIHGIARYSTYSHSDNVQDHDSRV